MTSETGESSAYGHQERRRARLWTSLLAIAVLSLAVFLLYRTLRQYSLDEIVSSIIAVPVSRLATAGLFAAASYLCLSVFDWLAVRYAGHRLAYPKTALASFVSLSLGHNIGLAALSSGAIRYRFYSRWGLTGGEVAKVILFCGVTVGLGLMILGGIALILRFDLAQQITGLNRWVLMPLGVICLGTPVIYVLLAAVVRRPLRLQGWTLGMPSVRLALAQVIIGPTNFACVAGCLYQALAAAADVPYLAVASVYVIANVTSLISHVPGGLGVIEGVTIFLLPGGNFIGALVVFRFVYFLVPLAFGSMLFAVTEAAFKRQRATPGLG